MLRQQAHVSGVSVVRRHVERSGAHISKIVPPQLDQRRIPHRAAFLLELLFLPGDPSIGIRPMVEQRFREFQRSHVSGRQRRSVGSVSQAIATVRARFAQPRERMQRRSAGVGRVGIRAVIQQNRSNFEIGVDHRDV